MPEASWGDFGSSCSLCDLEGDPRLRGHCPFPSHPLHLHAAVPKPAQGEEGATADGRTDGWGLGREEQILVEEIERVGAKETRGVGSRGGEARGGLGSTVDGRQARLGSWLEGRRGTSPTGGNTRSCPIPGLSRAETQVTGREGASGPDLAPSHPPAGSLTRMCAAGTPASSGRPPLRGSGKRAGKTTGVILGSGWWEGRDNERKK